MVEVKAVNVRIPIPEYNRAVAFKESHGRPTWMEMIMGFIDIMEDEEKRSDENDKTKSDT